MHAGLVPSRCPAFSRPAFSHPPVSAPPSKLYEIFCACCLSPRLDLPLTAMQYVMYFRFCGWRHIFTQWTRLRVRCSELFSVTLQIEPLTCPSAIRSDYGRPMKQGRPLYFCPVVSFFLLLSSIFFPRLTSAAADWMSTILPHMVWPCANLECRSEMCCTRLTEVFWHSGALQIGLLLLL